jgi:hypothetical protein
VDRSWTKTKTFYRQKKTRHPPGGRTRPAKQPGHGKTFLQNTFYRASRRFASANMRFLPLFLRGLSSFDGCWEKGGEKDEIHIHGF